MGSHLFKTPQEDKTKVSLAVTRRNARSIRRNTLRTSLRLTHCLALLVEAGLVPNSADKKWFQTVKGDKPVLKLRAMGLARLLTDREFAQVLYSLCGRRGYIPHMERASSAKQMTSKAERSSTQSRKTCTPCRKGTTALAVL